MPNKQRYPNDPKRPMNANAGNRDNKDQDNVKRATPEHTERAADETHVPKSIEDEPTGKHAKH